MVRRGKGTSRNTLFYVYCVIKRPSNQLSLQNVRGFGPAGLIAFGDMAAVVSRVPASQFSQQEIDKRVRDMRWLADAATRHEEAVEAVMRTTAVVPMKLCTIFTGEKGVVEMLRQNCRKFTATLKRVQGRVELGVAAYCNFRRAKNRLAGVSQKAEVLQKQMAESTPGRAYFLKRELEDVIVAEAHKQARILTNVVFEELRKCSDEAVLNKPLSAEATQSKNTMILNAAYLIRKDRINAFKSMFQKAKKRYGRLGIVLKMTGPWPPYNFC